MKETEYATYLRFNLFPLINGPVNVDLLYFFLTCELSRMAVCQSDKVTLICVYQHPPSDQLQQPAMQSSEGC